MHFFNDPRKKLVGQFGTTISVGKNTLAIKMKEISKLAHLSREYTNHSIRATSVTILDDYGFEARHIMCVSGHRSESSIRSYASKTTENIKLAMSTSLSSALCENPETGNLLQESENSMNIQNKNVAIESSSRIQFNFYDCSVNILNK